MYRDGHGVGQSDAEAVRLFRLAADRGDLDAQKNLGDMYQGGRGVPRSLADAISWYQRAARAGLNDAQTALKALGQTW
jgi:TPR repeat protein